MSNDNENNFEPYTVAFSIEWCKTCNCPFVRCPKCGNNSCNGGYGKNGKCEICQVAYKLASALDSGVESSNSPSPAAIEMDSLVIHPLDDDLPTLMSMLGEAADLEGESVDLVRKVRDEWRDAE